MNITSRHKIRTLKKRPEIETVLRKGKKIRTMYGPVFLSDGDSDVTKVAILLKKTVGGAVQRNYIKRVFRHAIRELHFEVIKFNRIVFIFNSNNVVRFTLIKRELKYAFAKK